MSNIRLTRDIALVLAVKAAALVLIWFLFFSPTHRPAVDAAAWIAGEPSSAQTPAR